MCALTFYRGTKWDLVFNYSNQGAKYMNTIFFQFYLFIIDKTLPIMPNEADFSLTPYQANITTV